MGETIYTEKEILSSNCTNKNHKRKAIRLVTGNTICEDCRQEKLTEFYNKK